MRTDPHARASSNGSRDPWRDAPTSELGDQVLPRWFVLTAIACVIVAIVVLVAAFVLPSRAPVPVAARRPPASQAFTTAVGEVLTGPSQPQAYDAPCETVQGIRVAGMEADRARLRRGVAALCNIALPDDAAAALRRFAEQQGIVRFATFEATGVDSTASRVAPPTILLNARFARTNPLWLTPLLVHDAVALRGDPSTADTALVARRAEAAVCDRLGDAEPSRGCADAAAVLALDDPIAALRDAGFE